MNTMELRERIDSIMPCAYLIVPSNGEKWEVTTINNNKRVVIKWERTNGFIVEFEGGKCHFEDESTIVWKVIDLLTDDGTSGYLN